MKLLLDSCVWGGTARALRLAGHDVVWSGDWPEDPGDDEILRWAYRRERVLVTLDKDFGELAVVHRRPHAGILRLVGFAARQQARMCIQVLERCASDLSAGALVTLDSTGRLRIRAPDHSTGRAPHVRHPRRR
jgi:predicted nuclease of predicted toxin-antitoxin system